VLINIFEARPLRRPLCLIVMQLEIDISLINLASEPDGITLSEILSVHNNSRSKWKELEDFPREFFYSIQCGYSNKKRILLIASRIALEKRQILQVRVADEEELEEYYCRG